MQVKIESAVAQPAPKAPGRASEERAKSKDDASAKADARGARPGGLEVDVSRPLRRARRGIDARRAGEAPAREVSSERLALEPAAIADRIRSNPGRAIAAQGEVDPARAHRLLSQLPAVPPEGRSVLETANENRRASEADAARFEAASRALLARRAGGGVRAEGEAERAAWRRSLAL